MALHSSYVVVLVTGCLHLVFGFTCIMNGLFGLSVVKNIIGFSVCELIVGISNALVGSIGIAITVEMNKDLTIRQSMLLNGSPGISDDYERLVNNKIRKLRFAHKVTASLVFIFSAISFVLASNVLYTATRTQNEIQADIYNAIAGVGVAMSLLGFILAMVTATMCRCSYTNILTIFRVSPQQFIAIIPDESTTQYQSLPNTTREYLQPINTMQNQTPGYGAMLPNPPPYQKYDDSTNPQQ